MTEIENKSLTTISDNLKGMLEKKMEALPKNFNETRFLQNCLTVLSETKDIAKYDPRSVARTMLKGAFLGLDFFNKECYPIPYGNELQFQTDYKGEIKVCKRWSTRPISDIYAKVVRKGDSFEAFVRNGKQVVNFSPVNFSNEEVEGVFAVVYYSDGSMVFDTMSLKEIEHIRTTYSKMPDGKAWKNSPEEMQKKTVIRRLCKLIDLNFDNDDQRKAFDEGGDLDKNKIKDTIDVEAQVSDPFEKEDKDKTDKGDPRFKKPLEEKPEEIKDPDEQLKKELREIHPEESEWQIEARVKERHEAEQQ